METKKLRVIEGPSTRPLVAAPPAIALTVNGTHYLCGYCRTLLLIAQAGEFGDGVVLCKNCGRYNEQET